MRYLRGAAVALVATGAALLPMSEASARCWNNGWGWHCGPGLLALPFVIAGTAVAGAATICYRAVPRVCPAASLLPAAGLLQSASTGDQ